MSGSRDTLPAPDLPDEPRHALVVATTSYADPALRRLRAPARDASDLAAVLADPDIGGFGVVPVLDRTAQEIRVELESFLSERRPDDLALVYLSGHGLVDARRRLYFAGSDTSKVRLAATGIESRWLLEQMEDCRARRQVLILDCCFSGAFALNTKGDGELDLGTRLAGHSRGRIVLTASRATEYSFEGEPVADVASGSVFTTALLDGLRTGAADANNDGYISVEEAYDYAFGQVRTAGASQTPQRWVFGAEGGSIVLARSPAGLTIGAAPLPDALRGALENPFADIRIGAVHALAEWLRAPDPSKVLAARRALHRTTESDVARVAKAAQALLDSQRKPAASNPPVAILPVADAPTEPGEDGGADRADDEIPLPLLTDEDLAGLSYDSVELPVVPRRILPLESEPSNLTARYLFPTERFRGEWRQHWVALVKRLGYAGAATALALTLPGIGYLPATVDEAVVRTGLQVTLGAIAVLLLSQNLAWYFHRFVLTNKRVMMITGLVNRHVSMVPLLRVTDMNYSQTVLGRLLNYGTFHIESAKRLGRMRKIRNLPNPNELYLRVVEEMYEPEAVEARLDDSAI